MRGFLEWGRKIVGVPKSEQSRSGATIAAWRTFHGCAKKERLAVEHEDISIGRLRQAIEHALVGVTCEHALELSRVPRRPAIYRAVQGEPASYDVHPVDVPERARVSSERLVPSASLASPTLRLQLAARVGRQQRAGIAERIFRVTCAQRLFVEGYIRGVREVLASPSMRDNPMRVAVEEELASALAFERRYQ